MKSYSGGMSAAAAMPMGKAPKEVPKVLHHLEVHPQFGGGVHVHHVHTEPHIHAPKIHKFAAHEGAKFHDHIDKHTGMSWDAGDQGEDKINKQGQEAE